MTLVDHKPGCSVLSGVAFCTCGAISRMAAEALADAPYIHPKAHVDETVSLGARTKVWQFASVTGGTVLGADCSVSPSAMLHGPKFGDRCIVSGGVMMGPGFVFGSDCFVGPNVTLCNDAWPRADKTGWHVDLLRSGAVVAVRIEDGASIGANAVDLPGVRIGKGAMIAAGTVVGKDVPAGHLFKRTGEIMEINTAWAKRRMRSA